MSNIKKPWRCMQHWTRHEFLPSKRGETKWFGVTMHENGKMPFWRERAGCDNNRCLVYNTKERKQKGGNTNALRARPFFFSPSDFPILTAIESVLSRLPREVLPMVRIVSAWCSVLFSHLCTYISNIVLSLPWVFGIETDVRENSPRG